MAVHVGLRTRSWTCQTGVVFVESEGDFFVFINHDDSLWEACQQTTGKTPVASTAGPRHGENNTTQHNTTQSFIPFLFFYVEEFEGDLCVLYIVGLTHTHKHTHAQS